MKIRIIFTFALSLLFPAAAVAQWTDFPPDICCSELKPREKMAGPVRTVLETEKRLNGAQVDTFDTSVTTYDSTGRKLEKLHHNAGTTPEAPVGKLIRLDHKGTYTYDSLGRLIQTNLYDEEGPQYAKDIFRYDDKGHLSEEENHVRGKLVSKRAYTHEPEQNKITAAETNYYNENRSPQVRRLVYSFNANERSVRMTVFSRGELDWSILYSFDEKGHLVKLDRDGGRFKFAYVYSYKYDRHGNWIEREERDAKKAGPSGQITDPPRMVTFRVITYHDDK